MRVRFKKKRRRSLWASDHVLVLSQTTYRGVKNPEAVERKRKKQEEIEKQAMTTSASGGGGLKVGPVTLPGAHQLNQLNQSVVATVKRFLSPLQWQVG